MIHAVLLVIVYRNTSVLTGDLLGIRPIIGERYDLAMYFSVIYDLVKNNRLTDIITAIRKHMGRYCVIEVPVIGDQSLDKIIEDNPKLTNYEHLDSPYTFRAYLCRNNIKVSRCWFINYPDQPHIKRYLFLLGGTCGSPHAPPPY